MIQELVACHQISPPGNGNSSGWSYWVQRGSPKKRPFRKTRFIYKGPTLVDTPVFLQSSQMATKSYRWFVTVAFYDIWKKDSGFVHMFYFRLTEIVGEDFKSYYVTRWLKPPNLTTRVAAQLIWTHYLQRVLTAGSLRRSKSSYLWIYMDFCCSMFRFHSSY